MATSLPDPCDPCDIVKKAIKCRGFRNCDYHWAIISVSLLNNNGPGIVSCFIIPRGKSLIIA